MAQETIVSGIQPTGKLHIGNYLGALRNFVELQKKHRCFFMVVDYHSITENYKPEEKPEQIYDLAASYLAIGLDQKKCTVFVQSHVSEHTELAWIFNTLTPISFLERMTQFKDKAERQKSNINVGLFGYPVLQAADILLYHATAVPVGKDQDQHLELTREIARFFNNKFGQTFKEPKTLHTEIPKVMSLLMPDKKMSKSLGDNHCLYLDDEPEVIAKKLSKAVTDTGDGRGMGAQNLLGLAKEFSDDATFKKFDQAAKKGQIRYGELKETLAKDIADYFAKYRTAKKKIKRQEVDRVIVSGAKAAKKVAEKTMAEVKKKIGVR